jgi:hypothetical protein
VVWSAVICVSSWLAEAGCIERRASIIRKRLEGLSGEA